MKQAITLMLEADTVNWLEVVAKNLSRQRNREVTKGEAADHLIMKHWRKMLIRQQEKRHERREDRKYIENKYGLKVPKSA